MTTLIFAHYPIQMQCGTCSYGSVKDGSRFLPQADAGEIISGRSNSGDGDGSAESVQLGAGTDWDQAKVNSLLWQLLPGL